MAEGFHVAAYKAPNKKLCCSEKVLMLFVAHHSQAEIARFLGKNPQEIKGRLAVIREKIEANTTTHAVYRYFVERVGQE